MGIASETVLVLNCGGAGAQKVARVLRANHICAMVAPFGADLEGRLAADEPRGIIVCADRITSAIAERIEALPKYGLPVMAVGAAAEILPGVSSMMHPDAEKLTAFCREKCGCSGSWRRERFIADAIEGIREQVGDEKVLVGLSGGVDSSVAAALIHRAVGDNLTCVFVDNGLLRKGEAEAVRELFGRTFNMNLKYVDASDRFLDKLAGVPDPERKRKVISAEFLAVFSEIAAEVNAPFLGRGTIYSDILESVSADGGGTGIKSHHNVGDIPADMRFKLVEPLAKLFKNEVREVGCALGLPPELLNRHPFPGPSLGVRHVGGIERHTLEMLREADAIVTGEMLKSGWYGRTWQTFAVFIPVRTVGVKEQRRSYEYTVAIRSVNSVDNMSAEAVRLPWDLLFRMADRITAEVEGVNRVVYDITNKPPATIEWE
ncbi:MAG: glutamine-hydrolyzing GMP synthase [Victivallaceae bacterium]|nr:glutamine-hydrolyzing GMP synthase [Victivallaceae bacterium]